MSPASQHDDPPPPTPKPSPYYKSKDPHYRHRKYTEKDYEEIYYHFEDISDEILFNNASKFLSIDSSNEGLYQWENMILEEASEADWEGLKKSCLLGMGCGLLTFSGMRLGRGAGLFGRGGGLSRYRSSPSGGSSSYLGGGYRLDPNPHVSGNPYQSGSSSAPAPKSPFYDFTLASILGMTVSLSAWSTDAFYPKTTIIQTDEVDNNGTKKTVEVASPPPPWISPQIPLVPGRSIISDESCNPITDEFRKFPKELWQSGSYRKGIENGYHNHMGLYANGGWKDTKYYNRNSNATVVALGEHGHGHAGSVKQNDGSAKGMYESLLIDSLQGFVINCERRSRYERKLKKIRGWGRGNDESPIVVPVDGVPADETLELDDVYCIEEGDEMDETETSAS